MAMSPEKMMAAIERNLPEKTGHTLKEWIEIVKRDGPENRKGIINWLKTTHNLGHGTAQLIATKTLQPHDYNIYQDARLIDDQYKGDKAGLKPIYERLKGIIISFGDDIEIGPRKTYTSFSRGRQFALIQPSTRSRIDVGLVLSKPKSATRLQNAGNFGSGRISHKVSINSEAEIDAELIEWLKEAYEMAK